MKVTILDSNDHDPSITFRHIPNSNGKDGEGYSVIDTEVRTFTSMVIEHFYVEIRAHINPPISWNLEYYASLIFLQVKPGTSVAAVTVTDADRGIFGETDLDIVSGNEEGR